ncbi:ATP-binding cassette domain-containing protein [Bradyrhizobium sp. 200]|uniref:branched-chain amino acid ABC transporter ATP-binding protein/permease n=1 Tax=Bradyrhizobium sp. 200 TaxID=2782665 RepID=UPI001FFF3E89|nr:ATP-binding cassette domain-containing protein [Bradyrhizobium sp. 200]UPJ48409.1 ATP-binding cassette domain-containing protein [Bradyrhizobium sp. 200]
MYTDSLSKPDIANDKAADLAAARTWAAWAASATPFVLTLLFALLPLISQGSYSFARYGVAIAYVMTAVGLNLAIGYTGELVLGHAVVMAAGAYGAGILSFHAGLSFIPAVLGGVAFGTLAGALIMLPGLRVRGWYLALITMFAVLAFSKLVILTEEWTGGEFGLTGIQPPGVLGYVLPDWALYEFSLLSLALVSLLVANLVRSNWGYQFRAVRDLGSIARSLGIRPGRVRFVAYVLASLPAALAGTLQAFTDGFVNADSFGINLTLLLLTGVMLGGAGTLWGPFLGMAPLIALSFWVGPFSELNAIALGVGLLVSALIVPDGFVPLIRGWLGKSSKRPVAEVPTARSTAATVDASNETISHRRELGAEILGAKDIRKAFGGLRVLQGADITVRQGEIVGLIGPNGSGKSTLLNLLSGFIPADGGTVKFKGKEVTGWRVDQLALAGIGRTFQVPHLIDELSTCENIEVGLVARYSRLLPAIFHLPSERASSRSRREAALEVFSAMRFPPALLGRPAAELSLGLKRIVEIGRAVVAAPILLLLDEPAAGLNEDERQMLAQRLREMAARGITILVVEHNVPFVLGLCDSLVLLENGQVTCRADLKEGLPDKLKAYLRHEIEPILAGAAS